MKQQESKIVITIDDGKLEVNSHLALTKLETVCLLLALKMLEKEILQADKGLENMDKFISGKSLPELRKILQVINGDEH